MPKCYLQTGLQYKYKSWRCNKDYSLRVSPCIAVAFIQVASKGRFWINYLCCHPCFKREETLHPPSCPLQCPRAHTPNSMPSFSHSSCRNAGTDNSTQRFFALIYPPYSGSSNILSCLHFSSPPINPGKMSKKTITRAADQLTPSTRESRFPVLLAGPLHFCIS